MSRKRNRKKDQNNIVNLMEYAKQVVNLTPKNAAQSYYINTLLNRKNTIVFAIGPAGTGKTMLAVLSAIKHYQQGDITKIVITRPAVGVDDEKHGFLPGGLNQKMEPWTRPIFDVFREHFNNSEIQRMIANDIIEISPLAFMRGRTFKNSYIIADEMQNATPNQMKMLLTRIGDNSKMVVTGDEEQTDKHVSQNGLLNFKNLWHKYSYSRFVQLCEFSYQDIERHPAVKEVLDIYNI
jgi:phosphate starvation-inducible PhoH-like protein